MAEETMMDPEVAQVEPDAIADEIPAEIEDGPTDDVEVREDVSPEPVDDTPVEPSAGTLAPELQERAEYYGLKEADLEGMDAGRLDRVFAAVDRRAMQPQPAAPPPPQAGPAMPAPTGAYAPLKIEFGDDLDEAVTGPLKTTVDHFNGALKEMHEFRQHAANELRAMNVLREFSNFDRFVSGLGDEWASDYGAGATVDMNPQSKEFTKRLEVFNGAKSLMADAAQRRRHMSVADAMKRSHHAVHWDRIADHERKKLDDKVGKRRKGFVERPVKGKPHAMSPREAAIAAMTV